MGDKDTIQVAFDVSRKIWVHAQGDPAKTVAYGVAAGVAFVGVAIGYGTYKVSTRTFKKFKNLVL